jgi:FkbM family methyltransferase
MQHDTINESEKAGVTLDRSAEECGALVIGSPSPALRFLAWATRSGMLRRGYSWPLALLPSRIWGGQSVRARTLLGPMCLRTNDRSSSSLLFFGFLPHERRETSLVASLAANCRIMLDVGAQYGWYARLMAQAAPNGHVYAFEPDPITYRYLLRNLGDLQNARSFNLAVGAEACDTTLWRARTSDLSSTVRQVGEPIQVRCCTLDDFCKKHRLADVDFIKCDVEGGEELVLRGAHMLMRLPAPPIWMLEVIDTFLNETGRNSKNLLQILRGACPEGKIYTQDAEGRPLEVSDFSKRILGNNVFFVPPARLELFLQSVAAGSRVNK